MAPTPAFIPISLRTGPLTTTIAADALNLSPTTVRTHIARIYDKTGARSQGALIKLLGEILMSDRRVLRSIAMAGMRTAIEEYSWDVHARRLTAVYEDALREVKG